MSQDDDKKFNIQLAAQLSGLSAHTIRAWEKRYKALTPERTINGRRLYSSQEVDRLIMLAQLTHFGSNISQVANLSDEDLKATYNKIVNHNELLPRLQPVAKIDVNEFQMKLLAAVENYKVDVISQLLSQAKNAVTPKAFAMEILSPLIDEVNLRYSEKKFQNAQLQALFAIAKFHAGNIIYSHFERTVKASHKFVLTSVEKEQHTFSLMLNALICCHHKKHFFYLNSNLPAVSIVDATKATEATVLILTVPGHFLASNDVIPHLDEIIEQLSSKVKIWLVGDFDSKKVTVSRWKNTTHIKSHDELDRMLETYE